MLPRPTQTRNSGRVKWSPVPEDTKGHHPAPHEHQDTLRSIFFNELIRAWSSYGLPSATAGQV